MRAVLWKDEPRRGGQWEGLKCEARCSSVCYAHNSPPWTRKSMYLTCTKSNSFIQQIGMSTPQPRNTSQCWPQYSHTRITFLNPDLKQTAALTYLRGKNTNWARQRTCSKSRSLQEAERDWSWDLSDSSAYGPYGLSIVLTAFHLH